MQARVQEKQQESFIQYKALDSLPRPSLPYVHATPRSRWGLDHHFDRPRGLSNALMHPRGACH